MPVGGHNLVRINGMDSNPFLSDAKPIVENVQTGNQEIPKREKIEL